MITLWQLVVKAFRDTTLRILVAAAFVSLIVGLIDDPSEGWIEGVAILFAVAIVVLVTASNDLIKDKQFRSLSAKTDEVSCTVIRDAHELEISIYELVVGDLLKVKTGMILPVDGVFVETFTVKVDESSLTGESDLVRKDAYTLNTTGNPFGLAGSKIEEGSGTLLVCAVGRNSSLGETESLLEDTSETTPLQQKLAVIANTIGSIGLYVALATFVVLVLYVIYESAKRGALDGQSVRGLVDSFIIAVTIIVVAVPEGLPLAVTLSLAYSVGKMKDENNLVRHLEACEIMGGATDICTDKTGTLTQNRMMVVATHLLGQTDKKNYDKEIEVSDPVLKGILVKSFCLNSDASLMYVPQKEDEQKGNRTECALLALTKRWKIDYETERRLVPVVARVPFSSEWKWMASVCKIDDFTHVYVKGASEVIVRKCKYIYTPEGPRELSEAEKKTLEEGVIKAFANEALRTIAVAYKSGSFQESDYMQNGDPDRTFLTSDLVLLGIFGIQDPIRPEVYDAVTAVQRAHIKVRMVTGDNIETAISIARRSGIIPRNFHRSGEYGEFIALEGAEFERMVGGLEEVDTPTGKVMQVKNLEMFTKIIGQLSVLARSSPKHKYLLVTGLRQLSERVVAVTGDGANDAPALKKSDVGFAMNLAGTQLAKDAADIILVDDNFASIVTAVKWGRNIYDSIKKFIQFQLTVNIVALFMSFLGAVALERSPLTAVQMLWVNLIMDTFAALALATEPPSLELLNRYPYKKTESLIDNDMKKNIIGAATYQILTLTIVLFFGPAIFGVYSSWEETEWSDEGYIHFTIFFNTFVFLQVFNEINSRKLRSSDLNVFTDFFNNPLFLIILSSTVLLQILIVQFGGEAVNCNALTFAQHFWCLVIGAGGLLSGYVTRKLPMRWFLWVKINEEASGRSSIYTLVHGDESKHEIEVQTALRKTLFLRSN